MVGLGLAIFQQVTGINAIIYYADQIFGAAGFDTEASRTTVTTWAIGGVNVFSTLIAIAFIDRLGRRKLLLAGLIGMAVSLIVVGGAFQFIAAHRVAADAAATSSSGPSTAGLLTLLGLVAFIISFAFSLGPVVWTVINEIFPGASAAAPLRLHRRQLGLGLPGQPVLPDLVGVGSSRHSGCSRPSASSAGFGFTSTSRRQRPVAGANPGIWKGLRK